MFRSNPFLRWSFLRMLLGVKRLTTEWQVGDGREQRALDYVLAHARKGDAKDVVRAIDEFAYKHSYLINVGDEKGEILDAALRRANPRQVLELGTYCGYSATRMASVVSQAKITSIEFNAANAEISRQVFAHAGISERVKVVYGTLGDGGQTLRRLREEFGFREGSLDFVFVDHEKTVYLSDLKLILEQGWLHRGALVVADNVKFPGAPEYHAYMKEQQGKLWQTDEHATHAEYQKLFKDIVLVSEYLGGR